MMVDSAPFGKSCGAPPISLIGRALADVAFTTKDLKVIGIKRQFGELSARLDVVNLKRVSDSPSLTAALAIVSLSDQSFVSQCDPLIGDEEESVSVSEGRRGQISGVECEIHWSLQSRSISLEAQCQLDSPPGFVSTVAYGVDETPVDVDGQRNKIKHNELLITEGRV